MLAWAWRIAVGDPAAVPAIVRHHDWLRAHRDLDGDGLIWIVQPDESGLDASPQFDAIWGRRAHGRPGFVLLVRRNRRLGYDLRRIADAGGPVCCEVATNVLHGLSLMALGRPSLTPTIVERMYDEATRPVRAAGASRARAQAAATWAALAPLALPDLPEEIGRRLVEEHLLDAKRFWLPVPPPSVPATEPAFSTRDDGWLWIRRYWRGPTWVNAAWLVWLGLDPARLPRAGRDARKPDHGRGRRARPARVLRPVHRPRDGRDRLRLVDAGDGDARPRPARPPAATWSPGTPTTAAT